MSSDRPLTVSAELIADALDPHAAIASRTVTGGAAQAPMTAMLRDDRDRAHALAADVAERRAALDDAERRLRERARERLGVLPALEPS